MEYVFEDNRKSMLSRFFEESYGEEMRKHFHYTCGNSLIIDYIERSFDVDTPIGVFLDMPPGNADTLDIYNSLVVLQQTYRNLLIVPIISREYYYMKSLLGTGVVIDNDTLKKYLEFSDYRGKANTYEKLGKYLAKTCLDQCARIGRLSFDESGYRPFLKVDCPCGEDTYSEKCTEQSLIKKSGNMVSLFPVFPVGSYIRGVHGVNCTEYDKIHRKLIDMYNKINGRLGIDLAIHLEGEGE